MIQIDINKIISRIEIDELMEEEILSKYKQVREEEVEAYSTEMLEMSVEDYNNMT
jgi:hypothetical protein